MREVFRKGCNAGTEPLSGGGGGAFKLLLARRSPGKDIKQFHHPMGEGVRRTD
jgi:hypothetical protein